MKYIKDNISEYSEITGFIGSNLEKVIRLLDVLNFVFSKSAFKDKFVLKGGTAINLVYTDLKRLSVDIDLDYCGSLDRNTTIEERKLIEKELDDYMLQEEYQISPKSRSSFALLAKIYKYENASGNPDTIKVDINFMDRVHLYPIKQTTVHYFDKTVTLKTPNIEELFGMKINALIDRSKPRDLYDTAFLINGMKSIDKDKLRKAVVFYLSINNVFEFNDSSFKRIESITYHDVKTELRSVLKKEEKFDLEKTKSEVTNLLKDLLVLTENEKQYLFEFSKGNYKPSLLFDESIANKIENHPMAKWRLANINK